MPFYKQGNFSKGILSPSLQSATHLEIYQMGLIDAMDYMVTGNGTLQNRTMELFDEGLDEGLVTPMSEFGKALVMSESYRTEKKTIFVRVGAGNTEWEARTYVGDKPTLANLVDATTLTEEIQDVLFYINNVLYFRDGNGDLSRFFWDFSTYTGTKRGAFNTPPVKIGGSRIYNIDGIGDYVDTAEPIFYKYDPRERVFKLALKIIVGQETAFEAWAEKYLQEVFIGGNVGRYVAPTGTEGDGQVPTDYTSYKYSILQSTFTDTLEPYRDSTTPQNYIYIETDNEGTLGRERFDEVLKANIIEYYDDRLCLAGIENYDGTLAMSARSAPEDFGERAIASDPIITSFTKRGGVNILALYEFNSLIVFTDKGIWTAPPNQRFTGGQTRFDFFNSIVTDVEVITELKDSLVFASRDKRRLYQMTYDADSLKYFLKDLNVLNNEILGTMYEIFGLQPEFQGVFNFIGVLGDKNDCIVNIDDHENTLGFTKSSVYIPTGYKGKIFYGDYQLLFFEGEEGVDVPAGYTMSVVNSDSGYIELLIPPLETQQGMIDFSETAKIDEIRVNVRGEYGLKIEEQFLEPALDTDAEPRNFDPDKAVPLKMVGIDSFPVNKFLRIENDMTEEEGEIPNHEILSIQLHVRDHKTGRS